MSKFKLGLFAITIMIGVFGLAAVMPVIAVEVINNGDIVKTADSGKVYVVAGDKIRHITDMNVFKSYGYAVKNIKTVASLADYTAGDPVNKLMDGSLIKSLTDSAVYVVSNGVKRHITTLATFNGLGYKVGLIVKLPSSAMALYTAGDNITTAETIPDGALIKATDSGKVYIIESGKKRHISTMDAFKLNNFQAKNILVIPSATVAKVVAGEIVIAKITPVTPPVTPPVVTGLTATLASDTPVAGPVIIGQAVADLAHFTFTGNGTVTALKLKRTGVSADATLSNVYLFDGDTRLTDGASVTFGSVVNFTNNSGLFTVVGSKTISVKSDMAGSAGETVGVQLTDVTLSANSVSGLPLSGNTHSLATANLAGVTFAAATGSGNADPGENILVWQSTLTIGTRDVVLKRLALRQIGSIQSADIKNFELFVDGTSVATQSALDANGYVTFSLNKTLTTGGRILKIEADVVGGSGRTVQMSLRGVYDVIATDTQYNANVASTGTFPVSPTAFTVNAGTMTVVKTTDSASNNVTIGASDASLGKYTFTAYGEKIKVETLRIGMITTGGTVTDHTIRNVRILVNGGQVGSTTNVPAAATFAAASGQSFTTNFTVVPGTLATVEIKGDIFDSEGTNDIASGAVTAVQALFVGGTGTSNAIPQISLGTINVPSQVNVVANNLTIASGSISLAQQSNYTAQTVVIPQTAYKLGAFNLVGNSTEAVNINTFEVDFTGVGTFDASDDLTDVYIKYGTTNTAVKGTVTDADNTWSVSLALAKNQIVPVEVYATIGTTIAATDTMRVDLTATGVTAESTTTVYADVTPTNTTKDAGFQGQVITAGVGTFTVSVDASRPNAMLLDDSGTVSVVAFKFNAVNDSYTITDVNLTLGNATAVQNVILKDGTAVLATKPGATTIAISGLSVPVAANASKVLTVELQMGTVGVGAGTSGASVLTTLTSATARNSASASAAVTESPEDPAGQAMYVYKVVPTITNATLSTVLSTGTQTIAKFSIASNGVDTLGWKKFISNISKTGGVAGDPALSAFAIYEDTNQIGGVVTIVSLDVDGLGPDTTDNCGELDLTCTVSFVATDEQQISGSKTYLLKTTVAGTLVTGDNVNTSIAQPSAYVAPDTYAIVAGTTASFVWTDVSAASHSETTLDWNNGYLVKNLPTDSQTLTK
ncbi:MAG: hypothetical protein ABH808_01620 [Candidatus Kuenenbacteria bacterium]